MGNAGASGFQTNFFHRLIETLAIFRLIDHVGGSADHLDVEFVQHPFTLQLQRAVQRRLSSRVWLRGVWRLLFNDFAHHFPVNWLDIRGIGHVRVGHDGGGVGIHQHYAVAFLAQGFARLRAGVVELTGLADNDGTSAEDQDTFYIVTFWHLRLLIR